MTRIGILLALLWPAAALAQPVQPQPKASEPVARLAAAPSATISNGLVTAKIYLPDAAKGFYRGTRFDWAGVVGSLVYRGQEFYGPWVDRVAPDTHDYVYTLEGIVGGPDSTTSGPVEEYSTDGKGLGFDAAKPGGTFIKIGVGVLRRPDAAPYDHYRHYEIADGGKRAVAANRDGVTFTQQVSDPASGYGYAYTKTLRLVPGKPEMVIEHRLRNTGTRPIASDVYDHNFLLLSPGNRNIAVTLPFAIASASPPPADLARIAGSRIVYARALTGTERVAFPIAGFGTSAKDYDIRIVDTRSGAGMSVTGDRPLASMNLWSIRTVMAVEPHLALAIVPGEEIRWTYTYAYNGPKR